MKVFKASVVLIVLAAAPVLWGKGVPRKALAFPANGVDHLVCKIRMTKFGLWNLKVSAFNPSKRKIFDYLYSIRENAKGSMKDCNNWMKAAKKKVAVRSQKKRLKGTQAFK